MKERIERINELIKRVLSKIFLKEIEIPPNVLLTITEVETNKDLTECKVFVSVLPDKKAEDLISYLNKRRNFFHSLLNKRITLKKIPKIFFLEDKKNKKMQKIEEILTQLKEKRK